MSTDEKLKELGFDKLLELPFSINISFGKVPEYWEAIAADPAHPKHAEALNVLEVVGPGHILRTTFRDISILEDYEDELKTLLSHLFPEQLTDNEIKAVGMPFIPMFFNPTRRLRRIMGKAGENHAFIIRDFNLDEVYKLAGSFFLEMQYGIDKRYKKPIFIDIPDAEAGTTRHYRAFFTGEFSSFRINDKSVQLSDEDIRMLIDHFDNVDLWKEKIPPQSIDFEGFALVSLFDVTTDQALSELKDILLQKDVLHATESIQSLGRHVRNYLELGEVRLGIASYDKGAQKIRSLGGMDLTTRFLQNKDEALRNECFSHEMVVDIFRKKGKFIVSDVGADLDDQDVTDLFYGTRPNGPT